MSALAWVQYEKARAEFADGAHLVLEENDLALIMTRSARDQHHGKPWIKPVGDELGLDSEYNYLVLGMHWFEAADGLVILPHEVLAPTDAGEETRNADYDRLAYIDRAIEALQRARTVLER